MATSKIYKRSSYMPVSATSDGTGNVQLGNLPAGVTFVSFLSASDGYDGLYIPFFSKARQVWYIHVTNWNMQAAANTAIKGTVYFM